MKYLSPAQIVLSLPLLACATSAAFVPRLHRRTMPSPAAKASSSDTDILVLNFANTLEKLETTLYLQALATFSINDFIKAGLSSTQATVIMESIAVIANDENSHSVALEGAIKALGGTVNQPCQFNFNPVLGDPMVFLAAAQAVENVGVSAYQGGATLITDKSILSAALSIHAIEARHQTALNIFNAAKFVPQAFDMPLTPPQVLALAGGFLTVCKATDLGLTANLPVSIRNKRRGDTTFSAGDQLFFTSEVMASASSLFCQMLTGGAPSAVVFPLDSCTIPAGIEGPVYVYITDSKTPLAGDINVQDPSSIKAGPGIIFVENSITVLQQFFAPSKHPRDSLVGDMSSQQYRQQSGYRMPGADLGAISVHANDCKNSGDAKQYWKDNKIAVTATQGIGVIVIGFGELVRLDHK